MANPPSHIVSDHATVFLKTARLAALALALAYGAVQAGDFIRCPLADGFDHAVGKPDAKGYYKFRGFSPTGHLGEDWDGNGGGNTDLGDPVYAVAAGVVVHAADLRSTWGNVLIIRHAFRNSGGKIEMVDSLYAHLNEIRVKMNQIVKRGEVVATIGSNHGMYVAHLHLEMHKNLAMGPNRGGFAHDYSNFYSPTQFIESHRTLPGSFSRVEIPINTFHSEPGPAIAETGGVTSGRTKGGLHSLSIPVYRGSDAPVSSYRPGSGANVPPPTGISTADPEDFWSRVKSKLKNGGLTDTGAPK